jgi:hypothetical protein
MRRERQVRRGSQIEPEVIAPRLDAAAAALAVSPAIQRSFRNGP